MYTAWCEHMLKRMASVGEALLVVLTLGLEYTLTTFSIQVLEQVYDLYKAV